MTLGEIKDAGKVPSETQIFFLELEESKKCTSFGIGHPHEFHCYPRSNNQIGQPQIYRETCERVRQIRRTLNQMFPSLNLKEGL